MGKFGKSYKMKVLHQWMPVLKAEKESCYCLSSELYIEFIVYKASLNTLFPSHFIYIFFISPSPWLIHVLHILKQPESWTR